MLIALAILGIFLSVILIYFNSKKNPSVIYLGLFFLLLSTYSFFLQVMYQSQSVWMVGLVFINGAIPAYLIGPLLYLYVRSIITDSGALRKTDLIHLIPVLIYTIAAFGYIITPWSVKKEFAEMIIQDRRFFWFLSSDFLNWLIPNKLNFISRPGLILFYSVLSLLKLITFRRNFNHVHNIRKHILNFNWLFSLLMFVIMLTLAHTILTIISINNRDVNFYVSMNVLQVMGAFGFLGLIIMPFFYPSVLYGIPSFITPDNIKEKINSITDNPLNKKLEIKIPKEKKHPEFEATYLQFMEEAVENNMLNEKSFLLKDSNLSFLSRNLGIPAHHLTYYFREIKKQTFNDYRNQWRVKHAKELIAKNEHKGLTLEAVGKESGFSSKNAFFTAFKKFEQMTPGQFAENISDG